MNEVKSGELGELEEKSNVQILHIAFFD